MGLFGTAPAKLVLGVKATTSYRAAHPFQNNMSSFQDSLRALLNALDLIEAEHEEVTDTDVREQMAESVHRAFFLKEAGYALPQTFGMFSRAGDAAVRGALQGFLSALPGVDSQSPQERLAAFQDAAVRSSEGSMYDEYFGHADSVVVGSWSPGAA